jgi:antitoxin component of MazEF toxin-antitoxin module
MNIFSSPFPTPFSYSHHYAPLPPTFYATNMNNSGINKRKRWHDEDEEDSMDEYSDENESEPRKRRKFIHRMEQLQLHQPNQIFVSLRGNNQQITQSQPNDHASFLLNDHKLQQQEYIRRNEYKHEVEQFKTKEQHEEMDDSSEVMDREIMQQYGGINSLLRNLHIERSMRTPSKH